MARIEGGCLCGQLRDSAEAEPAFIGACHCRNRQKTSGSAAAAVLAGVKQRVPRRIG